MKNIQTSCPGSCGELFQCVVDQQECLLSYGIEMRSYAKVRLQGEEVGKSKSKVEKALSILKKQVDFSQLSLSSDLPIGKGFSSSTADMLAALKLYSKNCGSETLTQICAMVEPTDSVAFKDWTVINPLTGDVICQTTWKPEIYVYILEPVETVETVGLVRMSVCEKYPKLDSSLLLDLFKQACEEKNIEKIGHLGTLSALMNNVRLPKPYLLDIISLASKHSCLGINIAHSGTLVGILLSKKQLDRIDKIEEDIQKSKFANYYQFRKLSKIVYEGVQIRKESDYH